MVELLKRYLKICLLTNGPEDLPYSQLLFQFALFLYFISGCLSTWPTVAMSDSIWVMLLDIIILFVFIWVCLFAFNKRSRFLQTITALAGVGAIFQLLAWPLLFYVNQAKQLDTMPIEASFLLLLIISWNLAAYAHIFRQAFGIRMPAAFIMTITYIVINMTTRGMLFPDLGV